MIVRVSFPGALGLASQRHRGMGLALPIASAPSQFQEFRLSYPTETRDPNWPQPFEGESRFDLAQREATYLRERVRIKKKAKKVKHALRLKLVGPR